jgi:hypothetical protein
VRGFGNSVQDSEFLVRSFQNGDSIGEDIEFLGKVIRGGIYIHTARANRGYPKSE